MNDQSICPTQLGSAASCARIVVQWSGSDTRYMAHMGLQAQGWVREPTALGIQAGQSLLLRPGAQPRVS